MVTANLNHPLMKIAHPGIYERNPFNVLNLPVDATAKDIRRRREDIEAAFAAGSEAEEFRDVLPGDDARKPPTLEEVAELFKQLEDPETRIAYALFWFWPESVGDGGTGGKRRRVANPNAEFGQTDVIAGWEKEAQQTVGSTEGLVARHNLAVFHHMMGLAYELALEKYDRKEVETPPYVNTYWKTAIHWWNDIVSEAEFWRHVSDFVSALSDSRVDYKFARSLRDQFAFAFDQINAELAIDFAKTGRDADAKRQVEYMKISQPDADDVEGTFDDAFAGLLRQVEAVVGVAIAEAQKTPKNGLIQANAILAQTNEPLHISRIVLEKGNTIRENIVTTIFSGARQCLVAYGNGTNDWFACLRLSEKIAPLAETEEQQKIITHDIKALKQNAMRRIQIEVENMVRAHVGWTQKKPEEGLLLVDSILTSSCKKLEVVRKTLPPGDPIYNAILNAISYGARSCMLIYCNGTKDLEGCQKFLEMLNMRLELLTKTEEEEMLGSDLDWFFHSKIVPLFQ